jgi:hypothetical protein
MGNIFLWVVIMAALVGAFVALGGLASSIASKPDLKNKTWRLRAVRFGQLSVVLGGLLHAASTSFFYVDKLDTAHVVKRFMGSEMPQGQIIALQGENGPQAKIYGPGLHFSPLVTLYNDIEHLPAVKIPAGHYGLVTALDGRKLPEDVVIASPLPGTSIAPSAAVEGGADVRNLFSAETFLDPENGGYQGVQSTVLKPGIHRLNLFLFNVRIVDENGIATVYNAEGRQTSQSRSMPTTITQIPTGYVGVVKSNIQEDWRTKEQCARGEKAAKLGEIRAKLVPDGCQGVWSTTFEPGAYFFNSSVYEVSSIESRAVRWTYKGGYERCSIDLTVDAEGQFTQSRKCSMVQFDPNSHADEAITVKVEGWDIPVELRVLTQVHPEDAPSVVAAVGSVQNIEDRIVTPAIRSIVRNIGGGFYEAPLVGEDGNPMLDDEGKPVVGKRAARALDFQDHRAYLEAAFEKAIMAEAAKAGVSILEVKIGEPAIPPELLVARRREQLSTQLERSFKRERKAQEERIASENAKARADQQPQLVRAEINLAASEKRKKARENDGEGEKNYLMQVAEGQRSQAEVLGKENVMKLEFLNSVLKSLVENPEIAAIVPNPNVLVIGGGGAENASAIGAGLLKDGLGNLFGGGSAGASAATASK